MEEYQKKQDAKMQAEIEQRRKVENDRVLLKEAKADKRRGEIETMVRLRKENRQRSVQEMIERTR